MKTHFLVNKWITLPILLGFFYSSNIFADAGSLTFNGYINESSCNVVDNDIICYSGTNKQSVSIAELMQKGNLRSLGCKIYHKISPTSEMTSIITISYL